MRNRPAALTELPPSPEQEQGARMVCVIACLFVPGWWLLVPALGAVFLPYVAVVLANAVSTKGRRQVERPGAIEARDPE